MKWSSRDCDCATVLEVHKGTNSILLSMVLKLDVQQAHIGVMDFWPNSLCKYKQLNSHFTIDIQSNTLDEPQFPKFNIENKLLGTVSRAQIARMSNHTIDVDDL